MSELNITRQQIIARHDKWLDRLVHPPNNTVKYEDLRQFWLFRELMFKHWEKFKNETKQSI